MMETNTKRPTYTDFLEYMDEKCDFREDKKGNLKFNCFGNLTFAREFFLDHGLKLKGFDKFHRFLNKHGAYCDCEVLWNADPRN